MNAMSSFSLEKKDSREHSKALSIRNCRTAKPMVPKWIFFDTQHITFSLSSCKHQRLLRKRW